MIHSQTRKDHIYSVNSVVEELVHHLEEQVFSKVLHSDILCLAILLKYKLSMYATSTM